MTKNFRIPVGPESAAHLSGDVAQAAEAKVNDAASQIVRLYELLPAGSPSRVAVAKMEATLNDIQQALGWACNVATATKRDAQRPIMGSSI